MSDGETSDLDLTPAKVPREIDGYQIQRVLGSGGMATVYAALQKQPRRTVALKVMRTAANAQSALRRFRREIEFLGRLNHQYIAQVFDAGVYDDGTGSVPYFVMEYVPGAKSIIEYAEARDLSLRERLKLFVKVCAAVEHGHRNKIIHRDLKPGNILIDEKSEPRVIDFGVARAVELDITAQTMHTEEGRLIGTVQYMAPEQLDPRQQDLDARCDVYALGVLLYKLLTGRPPHDLIGLPVFTAAQVIREDAPPRPSTFKEELKGDLETIILKALSKDRTRRYRTAGSLGRDIVRFLADKPINAREAGIWYRARLFSRRHRVELTAASVVLVVMVIAGGLLVYQRMTLGGGDEGDVVAPGPPPVPFDDNANSSSSSPSNVPTTVEPDAPAAAIAEAFTLSGHAESIRSLAFSPDGSLLAGGALDANLVIWKLDEKRPVLGTHDHDAAVTHLAFTHDGSRLASAADDGRVVLIDSASGQIEHILRHDGGTVHAMAISPDGSMVALGCDDLTLRLYRGGRSGATHTFRGTRGAFHAVAFSPDGSLLAAGSDRGDVYLWNAATGALVAQFEDLRDRVIGIGFSEMGDRVAAMTSLGSGTIWSIEAERPPRRIAAGGTDLVGAAFDPAGRWLACATRETILILDAETGRAHGRPITPEIEGEITAVAIDTLGRWVVIGDERGVVHVEPLPPS